MLTIRIRSLMWFVGGLTLAIAMLWTSTVWRVEALPGPSESTVVSVTPVRILDTRDGTDVGLAGPFASQVPQKLQVTGSIPTVGGTAIVVPTGATGVLLNVTGLRPLANGFISIRPGDATGAPTTSSLNVVAGQTVPNAVQVSMPTAGANAGQIDIVYDASGRVGPTTEILIDVVGYTTNAGLADINAQLGNRYTKAEVDAALAAKVTGGVITTSYGPGSWTNAGSTTFGQSSQGMTMSGDGFSYLSLAGPETRGGVEYTLRDVEYCLRQVTAPASIDGVFLVGHRQNLTSSQVSDGINRSAPGCYTAVPNASIREGSSFTMYIDPIGGGGNLLFGSVTATWDTRAALASFGPDPVADGPAPVGDGGAG